MKIRIKFSKQGNLKFIGHLDVMRYFQKLNRRAGLDLKYSRGFSPHQEMSFATPLGLGLTSDAEYVDMEFESLRAPETAHEMTLTELISRMNAVSVPELQILDACVLPDDAKNAMSLLTAADYTVSFREGYEPGTERGRESGDKISNEPGNEAGSETVKGIDDWFLRFERFLSGDSILTVKKTKTSTMEVDLKKQILLYERRGDRIFLRCETGSASNLKPELVMETFYREEGLSYDPMTFTVNREELYGTVDGVLTPLYAYGKREN